MNRAHVAADELTPEQRAQIEADQRFTNEQAVKRMAKEGTATERMRRENERLKAMYRAADAWTPPTNVVPFPADEPPPDAETAPELPARAPLDWGALEGREPPERQWIEPEWLPDALCLMAGDGGTGKTLIAQQWASLLSLGRGYLCAPDRPARVLMWASEDEPDELWRRQKAISAWMNVPMSDFAGQLILQSYEGEECALTGAVMGRQLTTPMLKELTEQVGDYRAQYVFLDNVARLYGGDEVDRHQVTTFCSLVIGALRKGGAAGGCLLHHTSRGQGSEWSGSSGWQNAVRSRLFLGRTLPDKDPPAEDAEDDGVRYLAKRKANYSDRDWRKLKYLDGVFVPQERETRQRGPRGEFAKDVVIRALRKVLGMGEIATASRASPAYLLKHARNFELLEGTSPREFEKALNALRAEGRLTLRVVGQYPNRTPKYGLAEAERSEE